MEDKVLDLLTKMYEDVHEMKQELQDMKTNMLDGFAKNDKHIIKLETKVREKLSVLFDGYTQHTDQLDAVLQIAGTILTTLEQQEVKINFIHARVN
ncbi:MAG: hypothetical protein RR090_09680 [Niameybacter sp.]|uniref:hypothetical protein n=1 Tax=Niameybacter sp. TaxID=2033640 RepID=UPI002FC9FE5A